MYGSKRISLLGIERYVAATLRAKRRLWRFSGCGRYTGSTHNRSASAWNSCVDRYDTQDEQEACLRGKGFNPD